MKFLYSILEKMNTLNDSKNVNSTIFPLVANRLKELGNILDSVGKYDQNDLTIGYLEEQVIGNAPNKALADLSKPLVSIII